MLQLDLILTTSKFPKLIVLTCILLLSQFNMRIKAQTIPSKISLNKRDTSTNLTPNGASDHNFIKSLVKCVNADSITRTIQDLQNFKTRWMYSPNRSEVVEYLYNRFKSCGFKVEYDDFKIITPLRWSSSSSHNNDKIWAGGVSGIIIHSADKGKSWVSQQKEVCGNLTQASFYDELKGWSIGSQGSIYHTKDGGISWNSLPKFANEYNLNGIVFIDSLNGWICANRTFSDSTIANIFFTQDGGLTWTRQFKKLGAQLNNIYFTTKDSGWTVGSEGIIVSTRNSGFSWEMQKISTGDLKDLDFINSKCGYVAAGRYEWSDSAGDSYTGLIYKTIDGGQTWNEVYSDTNLYFASIDFTDTNHGWIADAWGKILYTNNGGVSWHYKKDTKEGIWDLTAIDSNSCIVVSGDNIYRTADKGLTWDEISPKALQSRNENVVAIKTGTENPDTCIIIGAHYDSVSDDAYNYAPGADDNASGTAAIIEIARILNNYESKYTLEFVAFAGEEVGQCGSKHHAKMAKALGKNIKAMINFDMIAYPSSREWTVMIQGNSPSKNLTELASEITKTYTKLAPQIIEKPRGKSDHYWFAENGYQTLFFQEWEGNNPNWHKASDELSTLSVSYEVEVIKVGLATIINLAGFEH